MTYRITAEAQDDLLAIADFIGRDDPAIAARYVDRLLDFCSDISRQPKLYRTRSE